MRVPIFPYRAPTLCPRKRLARAAGTVLLFLWCGLAATGASAQDAPVAPLAYQLPPLDSLVALCLKNAPALKLSQVQARQQYFTLKSRRAEWASNVNLDLTAGYGNQIIMQGADGLGIQSTLMPMYRAGIGVRIPLSEVVNRKNQTGIAQSQYQAALLQQEVQANALAEGVTALYYELVTGVNVLKIRRDALQTLQIQKSLAEKDLKNGTIDLAEMSAVIREVASEEVAYETQKQKFLFTWKSLENLIGQPLKLTP